VELADLARLYDPDVMLVTAPMVPSPGARRHLETLATGELLQSRVEVPTPEWVPDSGVLGRLSSGEGEDARSWVSYVEEVTAVFAALLGAAAVGVRLVVSDGPHCPRFHVDRVLARGVLHLVGAPTEWLDEADIDRSRLGHAGGLDDRTSGLVRRWSHLRRAEPCELAVFKGTAWPGAKERAIVHRSPPADGCRRVLLTLDALD